MKSPVLWKVGATTSHFFGITPVVLRLEADQGRGRYIRFYMNIYNNKQHLIYSTILLPSI
jgi:hypothetical protein